LIIATAEESMRVSITRIGPGVGHEAVDSHVRRGRRARDDAEMFTLQTLIAKRCDVFESAARPGDQRISRPVIGIGALGEVVALREAHDDVAAMSAKRHPNETGCLRKEHVVEFFLQLLGEQFGELVLESLAFLVGEREIARVSAHP
jgi:hypothetical protein